MATTKIENLTKTKKKLKITVPKEDVKKHRDNASKKIGQKANVPGFREGKIPADILEKHYGQEIEYECINAVISEAYVLALKEHDLTPLLDPKFDTQPIEHNKDYTFWVEVETKPKFDLKEYKGLSLKKKEPHVTDKDLGEELKRLQETVAQLSPTADDVVLKDGLFALIDFEGSIDGKLFDGGTAKDYQFEFGKGQLLKEFEDQMQGMKKNEERTIQITFPADYFKKDLAKKKAEFKIALKNIHQKSLPTLDDELAKDLGKKDLEDLKAELKKMIAARQEQSFHQEYAKSVREQLLKSHKVDVPETIVEQEIEHSKREKKDIVEDYKFEFILDAIAHAEKLDVSRQDIEQRMHAMSRMYRRPIDEIQKLYSDSHKLNALAVQILLDKTIDWIIKNAKME